MFNVIFRLPKLDVRKVMELSKIFKNACTVQNKEKNQSLLRNSLDFAQKSDVCAPSQTQKRFLIILLL